MEMAENLDAKVSFTTLTTHSSKAQDSNVFIHLAVFTKIKEYS